MDEKTEELRDIFMSVSEEETVTEQQAETRGSLTDEREGDLAAVVEEMRDRYDFDAGLSTEAYCRIAEQFHEGADDADLVEKLDGEGVADETTAFRGRMDLHLYADDDLDVDFEAEPVRSRLEDGDDPATAAEAVAADVDADAETVERFAAAAAAENRSLRANHRFRDRFEELLSDSELSDRHAEGVQEDGLDDATEGMETDVSF